MNQAQLVLMAIGGTAELAAGFNEHYWADNSTPKKQPSRPRAGRGNYGRNLMAHFDIARAEKKKAAQKNEVEFRKAA